MDSAPSSPSSSQLKKIFSFPSSSLGTEFGAKLLLRLTMKNQKPPFHAIRPNSAGPLAPSLLTCPMMLLPKPSCGQPPTIFFVPHQARLFGDIFWKCRGLSPRHHRPQAAQKRINLRILLKAVAQFAFPRPNLLPKGAPKGTRKIEKYNDYNWLSSVTKSNTEDAEIT